MVMEGIVLRVREFESENDTKAVKDLERICETTSSSSSGNKMCLFTDLLGDPICRVRHSPSFLMLVGEIECGVEKVIIGIIRGCIKTVTCGTKFSNNTHNDDELAVITTKLAYILGLRVSPSYRRRGVGSKLVSEIEKWFRKNSAEYSYMATESDNKPSLNLFLNKFHYSRFRTPTILVQPVFAHRVKTRKARFQILKLSQSDAESIYRQKFSSTEFFPHDIDRILRNRLSLGTYVAVPTGFGPWPGPNRFLSNPPESWAMLSAWNLKAAYTLEVRGASRVRRLAACATRVLDRAWPCFGIPSVPDFFRPFGALFVYGVGGEGPRAGEMVSALCGHAHNLGREFGCAVVAAEVACSDPLRLAILHWERLSCAEDVWCVKRLVDHYGYGVVGDWTKSSPRSSIFVDPREF